MLDALEALPRPAAAALMYLGGNGFYWVTRDHPEKPHVIEVRRAEAGTRAWQRRRPASTTTRTTGELGGLWRNRGRAPQKLVGVGFTAAGLRRARRLTAASPTASTRAPRSSSTASARTS